MEPITAVSQGTGILKFLAPLISLFKRKFDIRFGTEPNPWGIYRVGDSIRDPGTHHVVVITLLQNDRHDIKSIGITDSNDKQTIVWEAGSPKWELQINSTAPSIIKSVNIPENLLIRYIWIKTRLGKTFKSKKNPDVPALRKRER